MRLPLVALALALALFVIGCGAPSGEPVQLLTGVTGCYAGGEQHVNENVLVADPEYGTRFGGRAVVWPVGFTGVKLADGSVVVVNADGKVVATTGHRYQISGAPAPQNMMPGAFPAAVNCGYALDFYEVGASGFPWFPFAILFVVVALGFMRVRLRRADVADPAG